MKYGYAYLIERTCNFAFPLREVAQTASVNKMLHRDGSLLVPSSLYPDSERLVDRKLPIP